MWQGTGANMDGVGGGQNAGEDDERSTWMWHQQQQEEKVISRAPAKTQGTESTHRCCHLPYYNQAGTHTGLSARSSLANITHSGCRAEVTCVMQE